MMNVSIVNDWRIFCCGPHGTKTRTILIYYITIRTRDAAGVRTDCFPPLRARCGAKYVLNIIYIHFMRASRQM